MDKYHNIILKHEYEWESIIKQIYLDKYNYSDNLNNIHQLLDSDNISCSDKEYYNIKPEFGKNDRQSFLVKDYYNYYDSNQIIKKIYTDFILKYIKPLFNEEIIYQTTPNIRFHLPNCTNIGCRSSDPNNEIIGLHCDNEFGHPSSEINVIIPITDMYESNSIYFNNINNELDYNDYNNLKLNKNEYFLGYFNKIFHYNKINNTNNTRVSFDFRIIPKSLYKGNNNNISATNNNKFIVGDYYSII